MRAFVLAAGEGRRLLPLTTRLPKPMIAIGGRPILEYNVRMLVKYGITDIVINTHHLPQVVQNHFGDGGAFGARISYSQEPALLGTAGALNAVRAAFDEPFLVMYGDNLTTCDLSRLWASRRPGDLGAMALYTREDVSHSGVAVLDSADRITEFVEKPTGAVSSHWVNAGLIVFTPEIFRYIPEAGPSDFGRDVLPAALAADASLRGYRMSERLWWIDSFEDYARTNHDPALAELSA
jgi:NDP-sugar pyrophosphorylase family protein